MAVWGVRAVLTLGVLTAVMFSGCSKEQMRTDREPLYIAYGARGSGHFVHATAGLTNVSSLRFPDGISFNGTGVHEVDSCLLAKYAKEPSPADARGPANPFSRPDKPEPPEGRNFGQTGAAVRLPGNVPASILLGQFEGDKPWKNGGVRFNFDAFGDATEAPLPLPKIPVQVASWGRATLEIDGNQIPDPVAGFPPEFDPEETELNWTADFYLLKSGIRNNDTKGMQTRGGGTFDPGRPQDLQVESGDLEAHLLLYSGEGEPTPLVRRYQGPQPVIAERPFSAEHRFFNFWFPGKATLVYRVTTPGPSLQLTELTFSVVDPGGKVISRTTMGGGGQNQESKTITVPLDVPRTYALRVAGNATLATYDVTATFQGQASLLWFWWEDVHVGKLHSRVFERCAQEISGYNLKPLPVVAETGTPPGLALIYVFLGVVGACLYGLFLTKLVMDQVSAGDFKRRFRKR